MRDNNVYLPNGTGCILPIPQSGCVWVDTTNQALETHILSNFNLSHGLDLKRGIIISNVSTVYRLEIPYLCKAIKFKLNYLRS